MRFQGGGPRPRIFDIVVGIDSTEVAQRVSVVEVSVAAAKGEGKVLVRRSPYGQPNKAPLDQRGWIYLERFVSMVKVAMVDETEASRVVFSNSRRVLEEILGGGMILRRAAQDSESVLERTLEDFFDVLASKTFGGASTDKLLNEDFLKSFSPHGPPADGDREVVATIMRDMVRSLPARWAGDTARQRQRQFELAVNRGDAEACTALLEASADVNHMRDVTALHVATRRLDVSCCAGTVTCSG